MEWVFFFINIIQDNLLFIIFSYFFYLILKSKKIYNNFHAFKK